MKKYYYDAFISYSHKDPDSFAAEKIHKALERYHVPKRIRNMSGKKKIERVFRDREELITSSDLTDNIKEALENSEYLIVVCSPQALKSQWVPQEIELFLKTHSRDKILAVLISGEPKDAFPKSLCVVREEVIGEDGNRTVVCREAEPLAADIRAKSKREMEKKLKTEILRLLAPILNCSYDDLRQRHREYTMKKTIAAAAAFSCLALAFTGYALYQSARVQEQYQIALEKESQYLAEVSGDLLETGDRMGALEKALAALPKEGEEERLLVQEAVFALNNALYSYCRDGKLYFRPDRMWEPDSQIRHCAGFSTDGSYYMEIDRTGSVYFYNGQDGTLYWKVRASELDGIDGTIFCEGEFYSDKQAAMLTENQVIFLDVDKKEVMHTTSLEEEVKPYQYIQEFLAHENYTALIHYDRLMIWETSSGRLIYQKDFTEGEWNPVSLKGWSEDGSVLAVEAAKDRTLLGETETDLLLLTVKTGEEDYLERAGDEVREVLFLEGDRIAILESGVQEESGESIVSQVRVYDCANQKDIWISEEYESHTVYYDVGLFLKNMEQDGAAKSVLGYYVNDMLVLADEESGENFVKSYFSDMIVGVGQYDSGRLLVGTRDGSIQIQTLDYHSLPLYAGKVSGQISSFQYNKTHRLAVQSLRDSNTSIVSRMYEDEGMEPLEAGGKVNRVEHMPVDGESRKVYRVIIFEDDTAIAVQDIEGTGEIFTVETDDELERISDRYLYEKDGTLLLSYYGWPKDGSWGTTLVTEDVKSGKEIYRETRKDERNLGYGEILYSNRSDLAASYSGDKFSIFRLSDGKTLLPMEKHLEEGSVTEMWFSTDDRYLLAAVNKDESVQLKRWNVERESWEEDGLSEIDLSGIDFPKVQMGQEKNLMAVYGNAKLWVVDMESGTVWRELPFYGEMECEFTFVNHDSHLLLYGDNQKLTLWNLEEERAVMERKEEITFFGEFQVDPAGKYFAVKEDGGYTETKLVLPRMQVYTLDMDKEKFYPYADVPGGWSCFETNEIGCIDTYGDVYVSPIRSFETLREQGLEVLE